jgi:hypothetical protein
MSKQEPTTLDLPEQHPGESDAAYWRRVEAWISGEDVRTKTDLQDWTDRGRAGRR